MSRLYDITLDCGCMLSADGGGGLIPCAAEYGQASKEEIERHDKAWVKWMNSEIYVEFNKDVARLNR